MAKYVMHEGKDVPRTIVDDAVMAERRLQMVHNYFQFWKEVLDEELGEEKVKELAVKWGRQQGVHTARVLKNYFEKNGIKAITSLYNFCKEMAISSEIMGETYKAWVQKDGDGESGVFQTLICPTGKMWVELGLGAKCCVDQCDCWMEETMKAMPSVGYKRTCGIDKNDFCEWEIWLEK